MAYQIIKHPSGQYNLYSSIIESFVIEKANRGTILEFLMSIELKKMRDYVNQTCNDLDKNKKPYCQFTLSYKEALKKSIRK